MGRFIFYAENSVQAQADAPSAANIERALLSIPIVAGREERRRIGQPDAGGFVGAQSRITRTAGLSFNFAGLVFIPMLAGATTPRVTRVAWLYDVPPREGATPEQEARTLEVVRDNVLQEAGVRLRELGGTWTNPTALPYNEATNGTPAWWQCGTNPPTAANCAALTVTRDGFDLNQQQGSNVSLENPIGPTRVRVPDYDPATGLPTPNLPDPKDWKWIAWAALGITALVYLGPPISAALTKATVAKRATETARKNPRRRRRTRR